MITTLLIKDLEGKTFSILSFYERRARRILPALFLVMFACLPFAWMWMLEAQMKSFFQSLIAVSIFLSNFLFWRESDYFGPDVGEKPLLHTWSLAVEEQYYILFPIFLLLLWRLGRNRAFWIIAIYAAISLMLSEWGWRNKPSENFYLLPTRAWEILAGSIAAFILQRHGIRANNILSLAGLAAITFAIFAFDETTPFPSLYALVPVLGATCVIMFAGKTTLTAKVLSTKLAVGLGLISYSAYLWHQPLFAFARLRTIDQPSNPLMLGLACGSLGLAYVSWKYVEKPFRNTARIPRERIWIYSATGFAFFLTIGILGSQGKLPHQPTYGINTPAANWIDESPCSTQNATKLEFSVPQLIKTCFGADQNYFLLGDSHAGALSKSLRTEIENHGGHLISLTSWGCLPIPNTSQLPIRKRCLANKNLFWKHIKSTNATVILSARWRLYLLGGHFDNKEGGVEHGENGINVALNGNADLKSYMYEFLDTASTRQNLILVDQIPEAGWNIPQRMAKLEKFVNKAAAKEMDTSYALYLSANSAVNTLMERLAQNPKIAHVNTSKLICDTQIKGRCLNILDGRSLYLDDDHPSPIYASMIAKEILQHIDIK